MYCVTGPVLDYRTKQFVGLLDQNTCPLCYGDLLVTVVSLWLMQRGLCFYSQFYFLSFSSIEYHYLRFQSPIIQSESFIQSEAPWLDDSRNKETRVIFSWIFFGWALSDFFLQGNLIQSNHQKSTATKLAQLPKAQEGKLILFIKHIF